MPVVTSAGGSTRTPRPRALLTGGSTWTSSPSSSRSWCSPRPARVVQPRHGPFAMGCAPGAWRRRSSASIRARSRASSTPSPRSGPTWKPRTRRSASSSSSANGWARSRTASWNGGCRGSPHAAPSSSSGSSRRSALDAGCRSWCAAPVAGSCSAGRARTPRRRPGNVSARSIPRSSCSLSGVATHLPRSVAWRRRPCRPGSTTWRPCATGACFAVDGSGLLLRPGPRVIEAIAVLAELLDPEGFSGAGPAGAWIPLGPQHMGEPRQP